MNDESEIIVISQRDQLSYLQQDMNGRFQLKSLHHHSDQGMTMIWYSEYGYL